MPTMFLIFILIFIFTYKGYCDDNPMVEVPQGKIVGTYKTSYQGRKYAAFEGIPYAKPPIGELRFEAPQPAEKWEGTFFASTTYVCLFYATDMLTKGGKGTEDCLYVYVFVPKEDISGTENLDVVVHIHGGGFMMGAPKYFANEKYIMDKDVVYVSFNYRLGILGFLSTEDEVVPGNNGLKDQVVALRWIKENIKFFGGNPDSITLTGHSAGAASVHYHYLSPMSRGLFDRGISLSGTAIQHWALRSNPLKKAQTVADKLGCDRSSSKAMIECFKQIPAVKLVGGTTATYLFSDAMPPIPFGVVIEKNSSDPFLSEHPYKILKQGEVYDVPWITSHVRDEGLVGVSSFYRNKALDVINERWDELMPLILSIQDSVEKQKQAEVLQKIKEKYFKNNALSDDTVFDFVKLMTDRQFFCDGEKALRLQATAVKSPVYYYWFNYTLQHRLKDPFLSRGIDHGDDASLILNNLLYPLNLENNDKAMQDILIDLLVNYAANGSPEINGVEWKPIEPFSKNINYIKINSPTDILMENIEELCDTAFWNSLPIMENEKIV